MEEEIEVKGNHIQIMPDSLETVTAGIVHNKVSNNRDAEVLQVSCTADPYLAEGLAPGVRVSYFPNGSEPFEDGSFILPIENIILTYENRPTL